MSERYAQPYYVAPHAVRRFRERVANLPTREIREIIQAALQGEREPVGLGFYNHRPAKAYEVEYRGVRYVIPVIEERRKADAWPVVPTILGPEMGVNWRPTKKGGQGYRRRRKADVLRFPNE